MTRRILHITAMTAALAASSAAVFAPTIGYTACLTPPGDFTGDGVTHIADIQCQIQVIVSDALGTPNADLYDQIENGRGFEPRR